MVDGGKSDARMTTEIRTINSRPAPRARPNSPLAHDHAVVRRDGPDELGGEVGSQVDPEATARQKAPK